MQKYMLALNLTLAMHFIIVHILYQLSYEMYSFTLLSLVITQFHTLLTQQILIHGRALD